jgi:hypothetical protein
LEAAGLRDITARASAYGENCFDRNTDEVAYFAVMETDFYITVEVADLANTATLGDLLERILIVLDTFPTGATPGSGPGYIGISYVHGTEGFNLWFAATESESARALGLHGSALLEKLQNH